METQVVIARLDDDPQVVCPDGPVRVWVPLEISSRLVSVYICQRETACLVAVIELLSPVNKLLRPTLHQGSTMAPHIPPLLLIAIIAVLALLAAELPLGVRLPIVVVEVVLGIVVGPHGLHLITAEGVVGFLGHFVLAASVC